MQAVKPELLSGRIVRALRNDWRDKLKSTFQTNFRFLKHKHTNKN
jgi:ribosomal protein S17E